MTQEIVISALDKNNKFTPIISSYQLSKDGKLESGIQPNSRIRPYISIRLEVQNGTPTTCMLSIGNPPMDILGNVVGKVFKIYIGYAGLMNGKFQAKMSSVFVGAVFQNPTREDSGQGTDQIMNIPLSLYNMANGNSTSFSTNQKVQDVIKGVFAGNTSVEYSPSSLATQPLKNPFTFNKGDSQEDVINFFRDAEGISIQIFPNKIVVTNQAQIKKDTSNKNVKAVIIHNQEVSKSGVNGTPSFRLNADKSTFSNDYYPRVNTFIKSKYAVIGIDNTLNIDLAFVIPQILQNMYVAIENVGTNINIFHANKNVKTKDVNMVFCVISQLIVFSTWGDSTHQLRLLYDS